MALKLERAEVDEMNELLTCYLCKGFYRDAHTVLECMHTFCKSCILIHFHENNVRGSIHCAECKINLGMYGHLSSKMIYDRDLQSIVDKIYPEFIAFEKEEEIQHYKKLKIPLKSSGTKHERDDNQESDRKRSKSAKNEEASEDQQEQSKKSNEVEFTVKLNPCEQCDESLRLPMLAKRLCKVSLAVRVLKIKKFVHKRLTDTEQQTVEPEGIELLFNDHVLQDEKKLSYLIDEIENGVAAKATIEFVYRRKA